MSVEITPIHFRDLISNQINKSLNILKKEIKQQAYKALFAHYAKIANDNKKEVVHKSSNKFADHIAKELTNGDSGISQVLQVISKQMDIYNDITTTEEQRQKSKKLIESNIDKINSDVTIKVNTFLEKIKNSIDYQIFKFAQLTSLKGVGWKTISDLYLSVESNQSSDLDYVQGFLEYEIFLREANQNQCLWLTHNELVKPLTEIINDGLDTYDPHEVKRVANKTIDAVLNNETYVKKIRTSSIAQSEPSYASNIIYNQFYQFFEQISERVKKVEPLFNVDDDTSILDSIIKEVEEENGFDFTIQQKQAIYASCQHSIFSLTGLAGTGKSTAVKAITRIYEKLGFMENEIFGTSFTGQATYNLRQSVGLASSQCATMHRWLMCNQFLSKEHLPVPSADDVKVIIIDEFSMVEVDLINKTLNMLKDNQKVRIIFVGDIGQLPSINVGFAYDFTESEIGQQIELTDIVRQGSDSIIPEMANDVRSGIDHNTLSDEMYRGQNFRFLSRIGQSKMIETATKAYTSYETRGIGKLEDVQIIANTNNIVNNINQEVQASRLRSECLSRDNFLYNDLSDEFFYINDRVIIVKNTVKHVDGENKTIFNGAKGNIIDIEFRNLNPFSEDTHETHTIGDLISITIQFDSDELGTIKFDSEDGITRYMKLAYATSIHKSQGSTIKNVIMVVGRADMLNSAQLIYTGMTRTSNTLTLVSSANTIKSAIQYDAYAKARTIYQDVIKELNQQTVN